MYFKRLVSSFIISSLNRDFATIKRHFNEGFVNAIYVSDCLPAQLKVNAKGHQLCIAHLLRETENFIQSLKCQWSNDVQTFLYLMLESKANLQQKVIERSKYEKILQFFKQGLLGKVPIDSHPKVLAFTQRLLKNIDFIFSVFVSR